jgi:flagellar basal body rod protein FlgB
LLCYYPLIDVCTLRTTTNFSTVIRFKLLFADFAVFEAKKLTAADSKKSFEDAIKEVATKNASMFGIQTSNGATQSQGNPNQVQGRQPVTVGNTNTQGNANNSGNTVDAEVQAFLDKKFGKRR